MLVAFNHQTQYNSCYRIPLAMSPPILTLPLRNANDMKIQFKNKTCTISRSFYNLLHLSTHKYSLTVGNRIQPNPTKPVKVKSMASSDPTRTEPLLRASIVSTTTGIHRVFLLNTTTQTVHDLLRHLEINHDEPSPASKASIDALAAVELTEECAICLEENEDGEEAREMPCKHGFHKTCIEKWLKMNGNCPVCRYRMPAEQKSSADDDDDKYPVGSDEVRDRVTIVFVSTRRFGSHEAEGSADGYEEDMESIT